MDTKTSVRIGSPEALPVEKVRYCLYARKSSEDSSQRQALSIESQTKEMLQVAERDGLEIVDIRREAHSAKDSGQRPVFNELLRDLESGRYTGILTWAPDRLSRNAGDLGSLVDLIDEKLLVEVRTFNQTFTNSPNEKFLLMILGAQGKLENDQKSVNVKRGLRMRCEMGLWPAPAPTGYLNEKRQDEIKRLCKFQLGALGVKATAKTDIEVGLKTYAKYLLREGSIIEKRELLANLKKKLVLKKRIISLSR